MNRSRFVVTSIAAAATGAALAADGCSSSTVSTPGNPLVPVVPGNQLAVGYTTTTFGAYKLRTRTYNGRTYGPTFHAAPGTTMQIDVINNLPPDPPAKMPTGRVLVADPPMNDMFTRHPTRFRRSTQPIDMMNNPHKFNTTNLHVHGVQTIPHLFDPIGTSDPNARMLSIEPGSRFSYAFPIPADHPGGLYWYHPHHHGSTDVQTSGGMAGLIIISGAIDRVPEIAAARDIPVVVQSLNVNPTPGKRGHFELEPVAYELPPAGYALGTDFTMITVNGEGVNWIDNRKGAYTPMPPPRVTMAPSEVVRVRVLNGTNSLILPLVLPGADVFAIGLDGVNFLEAQLLDQKGTTLLTPANLNDGTTIVMAPANRSEFLVRAPKAPGTYTLRAIATAGVSFKKFPKFDLMEFVVAGEPKKMGVPTKLPVPVREYPVITDSEIVARRTVAFSQGVDTRILTGVGFYINNGLYDMTKCEFQPKVGTAEEWVLTNSSNEAHPLHLHDNSFQVISIGGKAVKPLLVADTILIPPAIGGADGTVTFRVRFKEFTGKTVYHCHILPHEDTGMMKNILMV